jgi:hypothetical protein
MKKIGVMFLFAFFSTIEVHAEEAVVIEVRKNIGMSKTDKIYKNFFINGGSAMGLNKGSHVDVVRRLPVHDPLKNTAIGDIRVKVGELEIIHSDPRISVARLVSQDTPENRPLLDYEAVMVGDRLDLNSIRGSQVAVAELPAPAALAQVPGEKVAFLGKGAPGHSQRLVKEGDRMLASLDSQQKASHQAREPESVPNKKALKKKAAKKKAAVKAKAKRKAKKKSKA